MTAARRPTFYEFFAGAGMVRAGLEPGWDCLFANDIDLRKNQTYRLNWDAETLVPGDVRTLTTADLPGHADLAWASFPCQDLSQAGRGAGLDGKKSGTFWAFWNLVANLREENRAPTTIVLENVEGTLTSHRSEDFLAICRAFSASRYRLGAVIVDAARFVPQSRPRLFIIAIKDETPAPEQLTTDEPDPKLHTPRLLAAHGKLPRDLAAKWIWWALPDTTARTTRLIDVLENEPADVDWHPREKTETILAKMNTLHRSKVHAAQNAGEPVAGTIYQRTRREHGGLKVQRCEVRFDGVAGCLRTPAGGSSLQVIVKVNGPEVRTRRLSSRETARLMGLREDYILPESYYEAYHLTGDGVAVPVVRFLSEHILEPLAAGARQGDAIEARQPAPSRQPRQQHLDLHVTDTR